MRVLIAEDDPATALTIAKAVESFGYQTTVTGDGKQAWEALQNDPAPIVVTDWSMPVMDGLELCRRIRANGSDRYTYVIFLTGRHEREHVLSVLSCGADDFIAKPLDTEELRVRLLVGQRIVTLERELREANVRLLEENEDLAKRSRVDALMGIGNRRAFEERVTEIHRRALRRGAPYAVIMCDIDRFKKVNDTYGHRAGDDVLKNVARVIERAVRREDQPFRYGGEEIVLLLEDQDRAAGLAIAERLRRDVAAHGVAVKGLPEPLRVTVSCGVASYPENCGEGSDWSDAVERADQAMYVAKENGRNGIWGFEARKNVLPTYRPPSRRRVIENTAV